MYGLPRPSDRGPWSQTKRTLRCIHSAMWKSDISQLQMCLLNCKIWHNLSLLYRFWCSVLSKTAFQVEVCHWYHFLHCQSHEYSVYKVLSQSCFSSYVPWRQHNGGRFLAFLFSCHSWVHAPPSWCHAPHANSGPKVWNSKNRSETENKIWNWKNKIWNWKK